jgi:hypothetical protein
MSKRTEHLLSFVMYELPHIVREEVSKGHVPQPMLDDAYLAELTTDQREELAAKVVDLAVFIVNVCKPVD